MKKPKPKSNKPVSKKSKPKAVRNAVKSASRKMMLVYGYDEDAQPHAAGFGEPDFKVAKKAAGLLGFKVFVGPAAELNSAMKAVKSGNVFASGNGFAPKIPQVRFQELIAALKLDPPVPPAPRLKPKLPASWKTIGVGDLVLAQHDDPALGYWPTVVLAIEDEMLSLQSTDFPEVEVKRHWATVALLYNTEYQATEGTEGAAPGLPIDWQSIKPEQLVLVSAGRREGFHPAIVSARAGDQLTASWRDEPDLPKFQVSPTDVALIYPAAP